MNQSLILSDKPTFDTIISKFRNKTFADEDFKRIERGLNDLSSPERIKIFYDIKRDEKNITEESWDLITSKFVPKFKKEFKAIFIVNWTRKKMGSCDKDRQNWVTIFKPYEVSDAISIVNDPDLDKIFNRCKEYNNSNFITQWYMRIFYQMGSKYLSDLTKFGKFIL